MISLKPNFSDEILLNNVSQNCLETLYYSVKKPFFGRRKKVFLSLHDSLWLTVYYGKGWCSRILWPNFCLLGHELCQQTVFLRPKMGFFCLNKLKCAQLDTLRKNSRNLIRLIFSRKSWCDFHVSVLLLSKTFLPEALKQIFMRKKTDSHEYSSQVAMTKMLSLL